MIEQALVATLGVILIGAGLGIPLGVLILWLTER